MLGQLWPKANHQTLSVQTAEDFLEGDLSGKACTSPLFSDSILVDGNFSVDVVAGDSTFESKECLSGLVALVVGNEPPCRLATDKKSKRTRRFGQHEIDQGETSNHSPLRKDGLAKVEWVDAVDDGETDGRHELSRDIPAVYISNATPFLTYKV